jgi:hypothetical protein
VSKVPRSPALTSSRRRSYYTPLLSLLTPQKEAKKEADVSLQASLRARRPDLIDRSEKRQARIQERREKRSQESEFKRQYEYDMQIRRKLEREEEMVRARQQRLRQRRRISVQDIYSQNKKVYDKLPEVQMRQQKQRWEEAKRLNQMRSSIYNKVWAFEI